MVAKLVFALLALIVIVLGVMALAFWYFNKESERQHEKDKRQMDQTDRIVQMVDDDDL